MVSFYLKFPSFIQGLITNQLRIGDLYRLRTCHLSFYQAYQKRKYIRHQDIIGHINFDRRGSFIWTNPKFGDVGGVTSDNRPSCWNPFIVIESYSSTEFYVILPEIRITSDGQVVLGESYDPAKKLPLYDCRCKDTINDQGKYYCDGCCQIYICDCYAYDRFNDNYQCYQEKSQLSFIPVDQNYVYQIHRIEDLSLVNYPVFLSKFDIPPLHPPPHHTCTGMLSFPDYHQGDYYQPVHLYADVSSNNI